MPDSITVDLDENFQASLTVGQNGGSLDLSDLNPCGRFELDLAAEGISNIIIGTRGEIQLLIFTQDKYGQLSLQKALKPGWSEIISGNNPNIILGFVALSSDKKTPIVIHFNLFRDDRRLTFNFL
ncbi:MAG: hypothetical protein UV68_C0043G0004 [Candidatus Collierbacteria bacterium GW2011_GWC2_43_12]|uniref:Uncharacterized protein n=1 Tax=Candidatus Collierbacteria bacterium GW2011_GWC2_43_12 TaxID=1618390 RepID=A0A0G1D497_9BACT|nr:MAG: hypothetical protein UV68_C0043G0004 [Candidatus Collierbacteria bacterium GW2011_GWC2_43_12]